MALARHAANGTLVGGHVREATHARMEYRQMIIADLLLTGRSMRQIKDTLAGLSPPITASLSTIKNDIDKIVESWRERKTEDWSLLLGEENAKLDLLEKQLWDRIITGDDAAILLMLRVMARRARMNGLDAPTKVEAKVSFAMEEFESQITSDVAMATQRIAEKLDALRSPPAIEVASTISSNGDDSPNE